MFQVKQTGQIKKKGKEEKINYFLSGRNEKKLILIYGQAQVRTERLLLVVAEDTHIFL